MSTTAVGILSHRPAFSSRKDPILDRKLPRPNGSVDGYAGLAPLPWFELAANGRPRLTAPARAQLPPIVDFHTHLGLAVMFAPKIDYNANKGKPLYLVDCDAGSPPCTVALDDYLNKIAGPDVIEVMHRRLFEYGWFGGGRAARSQTIPALVAEMDAVGVQKAVLLVVAPNLPFRANGT